MTAVESLLKRAGDWLHERAFQKGVNWVVILLPTNGRDSVAVGSSLPVEMRADVLEKIAAGMREKKDEADAPSAA